MADGTHVCTTCRGACDGAKCSSCGHETDEHSHGDTCPQCPAGAMEVRCAGCSCSETQCTCHSTTPVSA